MGKVPILPFSVENVEGHAKAIWNYSAVLFLVDSLEALKVELQWYFDTVGRSKERRASRRAAGKPLHEPAIASEHGVGCGDST